MKSSKKIFSVISVRLPVVVLVALFIATCISGYFYYHGDAETKSTALYGSFVSGLTLVIVQFIFSWAEYQAISKFQSLGVHNILLHRDDRDFYEKLIKGANKRIDVMGVTASRFMEHFADPEGSRPETKVLLEALSRGTEVRILVPSLNHLAIDSEKTRADTTENYFRRTVELYSNFRFAYFNHDPAHSIVVVDDECILGPVFPGVPSRHTPAIYISTNSEYARKYLEYFDREWEQATNTRES